MAKTIKATKATETKAATAPKTAPVVAATKAVAAKKTEEKPAVKTEEKKPAVKTEEKKPVAKKTVAKKSTAKKPATKRAAKKPVEKVQEVFVEYNGDQFLTNEIVEKIHEEYRAEGHRVGAIKSLRVYIDPENRKAYYVINDKADGKFVMF